MMNTGRRLQLFLLGPMVLLVCVALLVLYASLLSVRQQFEVASKAQQQDLQVMQDAASFSRDIGLIQKRVATALQGALNGSLNELQLYRMHSAIVNDLDVLRQQVQQLSSSALVLDANHGSAKGLQQELESYRRFVVMSTDSLAVDPTVARDILNEGRQHFRDFSIFASRIGVLLAERAQQRNAAQVQTFVQLVERVLWLGIATLLLLLGVAYWLARRASNSMLDIADALHALADNPDKELPLPRLQALQTQASGELGRLAGAVLAFRNALQRQRQAEEEAHQLAFYDTLTQLPNRRMLLERLKLALDGCARTDQRGAVVLLDLDGFKRINDARGHSIGDQLLQQVGQRLAQTVRANDTVARLDGDKFGFVLAALSQRPQQAAIEAEQVVLDCTQSLAQPMQLEGQTYFVTASVGITLFDTERQTLDDLLKQAEAAMYRAKNEGRNTYRFYDPQIQAHFEAKVSLEADLRLAVEQQQLCLFYQLQVDEQDQVQGLEALVRWIHPNKGMVSPAQFIPLAEESDLILPIGHWVLETACRQLSAWASQPERAHLSIAVNVSARQFRQHHFVEQVRAVLAATGAPPQTLKLELTESLVLENVEATIAKMLALRALGVRFSMDDFGTGYSSLQYLKRLPLDQLKIEQSFVRDITTDPDDAVIVQTIIAMGRALRLEVIAEGVETREQQAFLRAQGCLAYQGYLFSKPMPMGQLEPYLPAPTPPAGTASSGMG